MRRCVSAPGAMQRMVRASEAVDEAHLETAGQPAEDQGRIAMAGPDADCGADGPAGQHVALPVAARLDPADGVIQRQKLQRIHGWMIVTVGHDERRDGARDCGDLVAGKTLVVATLKELVRIAGLRMAFALEGPYRDLRDERRHRHRSHKAPERIAELVLI